MPLLVGLLIPLPSCAPAPATTSSEATTLPWRGNETAAYRQGHKDGSEDRRAGHPARPRQAGDTGTADYLSGYHDGYRYPHDNPWSRPRAYQLGQENGRQDKGAGLMEDAARHGALVPRSVHGEFARGYRDGWQ